MRWILVTFLTASIPNVFPVEAGFISEEALNTQVQETASETRAALDKRALKKLKKEAEFEEEQLESTRKALEKLSKRIQKIMKACRYNDKDQSYCFGLKDLQTFLPSRIAIIRQVESEYRNGRKSVRKEKKNAPEAYRTLTAFARATRIMEEGFIQSIQSLLNLQDRGQLYGEVTRFHSARAALIGLIQSETIQSMVFGTDYQGLNLQFIEGRWTIFIYSPLAPEKFPTTFDGIPVVTTPLPIVVTVTCSTSNDSAFRPRDLLDQPWPKRGLPYPYSCWNFKSTFTVP